MRRGIDGQVWRDGDGKVIAVNLGSDFTAEHEWGIAGIHRKLGITGPDAIDEKMSSIDKIKEFFGLKKYRVGIETRTQTLDPIIIHNLDTDGVKKRGMKTMWGIGIVDAWRAQYPIKWDDFVDYIRDTEELIGHWDENDFLFMCPDRGVVEEIHEALKRRDITVWLGGSQAFRNGGLIIAISSRLPADVRDHFAVSDMDHISLKKAAFDTGVHAKLRAARKEYYALSPRWSDDSKKEVVFWLNPRDQHNNNFGWYNSKELEQWTRGEGPIPKTKS